MINPLDCPVEAGKEYRVTIDAKSGRGDGIAHIERFVIFVPGANVGENIKVRIKEVKRTFAIGEKV